VLLRIRLPINSQAQPLLISLRLLMNAYQIPSRIWDFSGELNSLSY
jgi:hypothetical protein